MISNDIVLSLINIFSPSDRKATSYFFFDGSGSTAAGNPVCGVYHMQTDLFWANLLGYLNTF